MCGSKNSWKVKIRSLKISPENLAEQVDICPDLVSDIGNCLTNCEWKSWKAPTRSPVEALRYESIV
jgi:hypothetical protein